MLYGLGYVLCICIMCVYIYMYIFIYIYTYVKYAIMYLIDRYIYIYFQWIIQWDPCDANCPSRPFMSQALSLPDS